MIVNSVSHRANRIFFFFAFHKGFARIVPRGNRCVDRFRFEFSSYNTTNAWHRTRTQDATRTSAAANDACARVMMYGRQRDPYERDDEARCKMTAVCVLRMRAYTFTKYTRGYCLLNDIIEILIVWFAFPEQSGRQETARLKRKMEKKTILGCTYARFSRSFVVHFTV